MTEEKNIRVVQLLASDTLPEHVISLSEQVSINGSKQVNKLIISIQKFNFQLPNIFILISNVKVGRGRSKGPSETTYTIFKQSLKRPFPI